MSNDIPTPSDQAIQNAIAILESLNPEGPAKALPKAALKSVKPDDAEDLVRSVRSMRAELQKVDAVLKTLVEEGEAARRVEAMRHPFGKAWLGEVRDQLDSAADSAARFGAWLDAWTQAVSKSAWDASDEVLAMPSGWEAAELRRALSAVSGGMRAPGRLADTLGAAKNALADDRLTANARITLSVLAARCEWLVSGNAMAARDLARRASAVLDDASPRALRAMALSAVAQMELLTGRPDRAQDVLADLPDSRILSLDHLTVLGQLALHTGAYGRANDLFDTAASSFGAEAAEPNLLREVPANLLWRTARQIRLTDKPSAIKLLNRALKKRIEGEGPRPERRALAERAELFEAIGDRSAAAADYLESGQAYLATKPKTARRLLKQAVILDDEAAEAHLWYGESIRITAASSSDGDWVEEFKQARTALARGLELLDGEVSTSTAWALISAALVTFDLTAAGVSDAAVTSPHGEPDVLIERSLLLDDSPRALAFLLYVLRGGGYLTDAEQDIDPEDVPYRGDSLLVQYAAQVYADLEADDRLIRLVDDYAFWDSSPELRLLAAEAMLRRADLKNAVELLRDDDDTEALLLKAGCLRLDGEEQACQEILETVAGRPDTLDDALLTGWVSYLRGMVQDGIDCYVRTLRKGESADPGSASSDSVLDLGALTPADDDPVAWLDLAQMLVLRGTAADLSQAEAMVNEAMPASKSLEDLIHFRSIELPQLRCLLDGRANIDASLDVVEGMSLRADEQCRALRAEARDADELGPRLATARRQLVRGQAGDSFVAYAALHREGAPVEVLQGLSQAAAELLRDGDYSMAVGEVETAQTSWQALEQLFADHAPGVRIDERRQVLARLAVADLEAGADQAALEAFANSDADSVRDALPMFVRDASAAWQLYDSMVELLSRHKLAALEGVLDTFPMGQAYGLVRDRVGAGATPLIETAIELSLGERWADLASGDLIGVRIGELRDSLSAETGVRIPGMLVSPDTRLPSDAALVSIYGEVVGSADAVVGREPDMDELLRVLRDSLQSNMYRLVANDDVDLWAIGWDGAAGVTGADIDSLIPTEREARARLGWVLRSLLHESVPITERTRISEAFARYEDGQQATRADALAAVRTALYPAVCGPHAPDDAVSLRDDLLSRLHEGCDTRSEDGWELPRDAAIELLSDIRAWAQSPPDVGTLIRVDDSRCRRVLWRLLAAERPRVFVIATEEMP